MTKSKSSLSPATNRMSTNSRRSSTDELNSFLEHEEMCAAFKPKIRLNDITLNTSGIRGDSSGKRISLRSLRSVSSGYCSTAGHSTHDGRESIFLDTSTNLIDKSFLSNESSECIVIDDDELEVKTDLELFRPTNNPDFRQNVIDCDDIDVDADEIDELNSTLERVDFILENVGYKEKCSENRKRLLAEYAKLATMALDKRQKMDKRTISVDIDVMNLR